MSIDGAVRHRRVVIKVSGESLRDQAVPLDPERMIGVAQSIAAVSAMGVEVALVIGGGNIFRGSQSGQWGLDSFHGDTVGMVATGINALLLQGCLRNAGVHAQVFSRGPCLGFGHAYDRDDVCAAMARHEVVVIAGGMGFSGISTDVAAVHASIDLDASAVIMAKFGVEGVHAADPRIDNDAPFLSELTASEALQLELRIMDASALGLALEKGKTIYVVGASDPQNVQYLLEGKEIGSVILPE